MYVESEETEYSQHQSGQKNVYVKTYAGRDKILVHSEVVKSQQESLEVHESLRSRKTESFNTPQLNSWQFTVI